MNKVPYREMVQNLAIVDGSKTGDKHSAHIVHRSKIAPIAQNIKVKTNLNRLNLKTREDRHSRSKHLLNTMQAARDSFDVSILLLSPIRDKEGESG